MSNLMKKRIMIDIKQYQKSGLDECGIYLLADDSNIAKAKALIIGPKDTPYENGFYFFDIEFPNNYPLYPPKVLFCTLDQCIRFNPNLYTNGKVCVSILGTWQGPGWTSCMTLNTVLLSIQSLLNSNPIQNEPGWESENGIKSIEYNKIIDYSNYSIAILKMMINTPKGFEGFKDIMNKHFLKNINIFYKHFNDSLQLNNKEIKSHIYSLRTVIRYDYLAVQFNKIEQQLRIKYKDIEMIKNQEEKKSNILESNLNPNTKPESEINTIKKRKCPNKLSKNLPEGHIEKSENDDKYWIVQKLNNGTHRWKFYSNKI